VKKDVEKSMFQVLCAKVNILRNVLAKKAGKMAFNSIIVVNLIQNLFSTAHETDERGV
jgi:hypothetical protein